MQSLCSLVVMVALAGIHVEPAALTLTSASMRVNLVTLTLKKALWVCMNIKQCFLHPYGPQY